MGEGDDNHENSQENQLKDNDNFVTVGLLFDENPEDEDQQDLVTIK